MTETDYVPPDDSYTNADQPVLWEEPEDDVAGDDFSHLGELWLDEGDGHWLDWGADRDPEHRTRKPRPGDVVRYCQCGWPLAIRWKWSACEFEHVVGVLPGRATLALRILPDDHHHAEVGGVELEGVLGRGMVDPGGPEAVVFRGMGVGWTGLVRMLVMHVWSFL